MNLADEIQKQLQAKGELTAGDIKNRLRTYHNFNLSEKAINAELKSMRGKGLTRWVDYNNGAESIPIWRLTNRAIAFRTIRSKETVGI